MNQSQWMTKAQFFEALDRPVSEDDSSVFKQMNLFGPYYIQDLSFSQCAEYPKRKHDVTYKDRFPLYRMCDLAYPAGNPFAKETAPLRNACIQKCKELEKCKGPACEAIRYEMASFIKQCIDNRFSTIEEGVMQAYHPIVPYQGMVSRYEAEKKIPHPDVSKKEKKKAIEENTDVLMAKIGPRIVNPDLSDTLDLDYGFGTLGDKYTQSAIESLDKACAKFHLIAYGRFANDSDSVMEGFSYFDDPEWVNDKWENVLEAIMGATENVPPSIPTVNISMKMKEKDDLENSSSSDGQVLLGNGFNADAFRHFLALNQRYQVSQSTTSKFMNFAQHDFIAGYVNDGAIMHIGKTNEYVMPVVDIAADNMEKILYISKGKPSVQVRPFPSSHEIV